MKLPTLLTSSLDLLASASLPWQSTNTGAVSIPAFVEYAKVQSAKPSASLGKRIEGQCLWPVKTWPGGGTFSSTVIVELPCASTPWNFASSPTAGSPVQESLTPMPPKPASVVPAQQVLTSSISSEGASVGPASSSSVPPTLHMSVVTAVAVSLTLAVVALGLAAGCFFRGRKVGFNNRVEKTTPPVVKTHQPSGPPQAPQISGAPQPPRTPQPIELPQTPQPRSHTSNTSASSPSVYHTPASSRHASRRR